MSVVFAEIQTKRESPTSIWKKELERVMNDESAIIVEHWKDNCGRETMDHTAVSDQMSTISVNKQGAIRSTARVIDLSTRAVWGRDKSNKIMRHISSEYFDE